mmetsp:Transcript_11043/g.25947  ORF Transcript_11043/g.25947 Transcript_11043/m.25947 type:complete len:82 (+) Transcript_11043:194-439(+)
MQTEAPAKIVIAAEGTATRGDLPVCVLLGPPFNVVAAQAAMKASFSASSVHTMQRLFPSFATCCCRSAGRVLFPTRNGVPE